MISAIVIAPDLLLARESAHEIVTRSLAWLVSAVVAGVVRDVVLSAPPAMNLGDLADHVGCDIMQSDDEVERFRLSAERIRCMRVLVIKAGYYPTGPLADELEIRTRSSPGDLAALLLATPIGPLQNLMPSRAPVVGIFTSRSQMLAVASFKELARASRRAPRLETRVAPLA